MSSIAFRNWTQYTFMMWDIFAYYDLHSSHEFNQFPELFVPWADLNETWESKTGSRGTIGKLFKELQNKKFIVQHPAYRVGRLYGFSIRGLNYFLSEFNAMEESCKERYSEGRKRMCWEIKEMITRLKVRTERSGLPELNSIY